MASRAQLLHVIRIQTEIAKLGLDLGGVMQFIVQQTLPLIGADGAAIEFAEKGEMVYRAVAGIAREQFGLRLTIDSSLSGLSVVSGETLYCEDAERDPRVDRVACERVGLRSMIVMPLKHEGLTVGVFKAMSVRPSKFRKADVELLGLLSDVVAAAMYFSVKYGRDDLFQRATHDGMTGLANRSLFMDRLRNAVSHAARDHYPSGVLMIDMDGLKDINDHFGHRVGDAVIVEFSNRIQAGARSTDTVARLGGDEFGMILTPVENSVGIDATIHRIDDEISPPFVFEQQAYQLRASIGAALTPTDAVEPETLLEIADRRMYEIKKKRKKRGTRP